VPPGGSIGKIVHLGRLPVNIRLGACGDVVHADDGAGWQLQLHLQLGFMFPK
jgi:hypothetical protein